MTEYLIIDPNILYNLYNYKDVIDYYPFNFLAEFKSIDINVFYDVFNSIPHKNIQSCDRYIYTQWSLTKENLKGYTTSIRQQNIYKREYSHEVSRTKEEFNNKLDNFITKDPIISLYIMNQLLKYLYPCNL